MTRPPNPPSRSALTDQQRQLGARRMILRQQLLGGSKKINVGKTVGSFVPKLAQKAFEKYGFSTVALLTDWAAIVGSDMARHTRPEKLKWPRIVAAKADMETACEGRPAATLFLSVEPARALDVEYGAAQIVERINSYFGYRAVADLRILQVPLDVADAGRARPAISANRMASTESGPSSGGSNEPCEDLLSVVSDEKLRDSLRRLHAGLRCAGK